MLATVHFIVKVVGLRSSLQELFIGGRHLRAVTGWSFVRSFTQSKITCLEVSQNSSRAKLLCEYVCVCLERGFDSPSALMTLKRPPVCSERLLYVCMDVCDWVDARRRRRAMEDN